MLRLLLPLVLGPCLCLGGPIVPIAAEDTSASEKLGFKLSIQAYTFNRFTFFEAVDKAHQAGIRYMEAYPGQKIGGPFDGTIGTNMSQAEIDGVKEKLSEAGIELVAFGVTGLSAQPEESRRVFEWCSQMGIQVINTEAPASAFDTIEALCEEFGIKVGLHNHPEPSIYWDPKVVMAALEGRGPMMGACADTGHWLRSGLDPLECLKILEGRIVSMHFKDLNQKGRQAHDVPWGTGVANVPALLAELKRQGFQGPMSIEYEHNWLESLPEVTQCVINFHEMVEQLK